MAKKRASKKTAAKKATRTRKKAGQKKQVEQYTHGDAQRLNNPPVGLVTERTDPPKIEKKTYQYDPPYGIRYGSNFQPFVNKRNVTDGKDADLTQEPEMVQAFRDTWELGVHSYLTYLRDRLLVAREMLHESGSVFVQIGDENVHRVRTLLDELFGCTNFVATIPYKTSAPLSAKLIPAVADHIRAERVRPR